MKDIGVRCGQTPPLAGLAALAEIPVITSASVPEGPNGPLMPEIHQSAPHPVFVPRKGEVNEGYAALVARFAANYGTVIESFQQAQEVVAGKYEKVTAGE